MKDIYKTGYGWISPSGNVMGCECYGHYEALAAWSDVKKTLPRIALKLEYLEGVRRTCKAYEEKTGAGEWHYYEIQCDREGDHIYDSLMDAGYIRVGTSRIAETVEIEGRPDAIASRMAVIRRIIKEYNAENHVEYVIRVHPVKTAHCFLDEDGEIDAESLYGVPDEGVDPSARIKM